MQNYAEITKYHASLTAKDDTNRPTEADIELARLFPPAADWSTVRVTCPAGDYSAGTIVRAVEDCNAHVLNLNVTADSSAGLTVVDLRINLRDAMTAVRSLERYGFAAEITGGSVGSQQVEQMRSRVNELMHYLEI